MLDRMGGFYRQGVLKSGFATVRMTLMERVAIDIMWQ